MKNLPIIFFVLCTLFTILSCSTSSSQPADKYVSNGTKYFDQEKWTEAIEEYTKALELDPNNIHALTNRGSAYTHLGKYNEAIADLTKASEIDPGNIFPYYNRSIAYLYMNQYDNAIADCNKIIDLGIEFPWVYYHRAMAYKGKNDYGRALADFNKAKLVSDDAGFQSRMDEEIKKIQGSL